VWFNHWFSAAYHIIKLLKEDDSFNFTVAGSNTDDNCVYRSVCDEWIREEEIPDAENYVNYCLEFCRENRIDVFAVRRNMLAVSKRIKEFSDIGVKVLTENYSIMSAMSNKERTYKLFCDSGIGYVPEYRIVRTASEFETYYRRIKTDSNRVCFKFACGEGAVGFRVVDNRIEHNLSEPVGAKITYSDAIKSLEKSGKLPPLMVMPYLSGTEVSVDCLYMPNKMHIIIPRYKSCGRSETIKFETDIIDICDKFLNAIEPEFPINVQLKYDGATPFLLEVNARMSGGIQISCAATGVNIPNIAVNRLLGVEKQADFEKITRRMSFIEIPVALDI
jgi:carbamoylphosphate synthase large subunit